MTTQLVQSMSNRYRHNSVAKHFLPNLRKFQSTQCFSAQHPKHFNGGVVQNNKIRLSIEKPQWMLFSYSSVNLIPCKYLDSITIIYQIPNRANINFYLKQRWLPPEIVEKLGRHPWDAGNNRDHRRNFITLIRNSLRSARYLRHILYRRFSKQSRNKISSAMANRNRDVSFFKYLAPVVQCPNHQWSTFQPLIVLKTAKVNRDKPFPSSATWRKITVVIAIALAHQWTASIL